MQCIMHKQYSVLDRAKVIGLCLLSLCIPNVSEALLYISVGCPLIAGTNPPVRLNEPWCNPNGTSSSSSATPNPSNATSSSSSGPSAPLQFSALDPGYFPMSASNGASGSGRYGPVLDRRTQQYLYFSNSVSRAVKDLPVNSGKLIDEMPGFIHLVETSDHWRQARLDINKRVDHIKTMLENCKNGLNSIPAWMRGIDDVAKDIRALQAEMATAEQSSDKQVALAQAAVNRRELIEQAKRQAIIDRANKLAEQRMLESSCLPLGQAQAFAKEESDAIMNADLLEFVFGPPSTAPSSGLQMNWIQGLLTKVNQGIRDEVVKLRAEAKQVETTRQGEITKINVALAQDGQNDILAQNKITRRRLDNNAPSALIYKFAEDYIREQLDYSENLAVDATAMAQKGESTHAVKLVIDFAKDLSDALADAVSGVSKGIYKPFKRASDVMEVVFQNPTLIQNFYGNMMGAITSQRFPSQVAEAFKEFWVAIAFGTAYQKGEAAGELVGNLAIAIAGGKVFNAAQFEGLKGVPSIQNLGDMLHQGIKAAPFIATEVAAAEAESATVVNLIVDGAVKWDRTPKSIQDQMVFNAAQKGAGNPIIKSLNDPRYKGMEKWEYRVKSSQGKDSVVHYVRDPQTGKLMDFKFKKHSVK